MFGKKKKIEEETSPEVNSEVEVPAIDLSSVKLFQDLSGGLDRVKYDASEDGDYWKFNDIVGGMKKSCANVKEIDVEGKDRRAIEATDNASGLHFLALMTCEFKPDQVTKMAYLSILGDIPDAAQWAAEINERTQVSIAVEEEGKLLIIATPLVVGKFDKSLFTQQLSIFLEDLSSIISVFKGQDDPASAQAMLAAFFDDSKIDFGAAQNRFDGQGFARPSNERRPSKEMPSEMRKSMSGGSAADLAVAHAEAECPSCNGKGKRMLRTCGTCDGEGVV